jgi:hypothetical protein
VAYINNFSERYEILEAIQTGLDKEVGKSGRDGAVYRAWANLEIDKALSSVEVTITSEKDGSILAYLSKKVPRDVVVKYGPLLRFNKSRVKLMEKGYFQQLRGT